jgi:hypothetical protein
MCSESDRANAAPARALPPDGGEFGRGLMQIDFDGKNMRELETGKISGKTSSSVARLASWLA